jgi:hypothetical protein
VSTFVQANRALLVKHARASLRAGRDSLALSDVAAELELLLRQLIEARVIDAAAIETPDALIRSLAKHAYGRARRRHMLIEQVAAGDDLEAISSDIAGLDDDLPDLLTIRIAEPRAVEARATLNRIKGSLSPANSLLAALLFEDDLGDDEVAELLHISEGRVADAVGATLTAARATQGTQDVQEETLRDLGRRAIDAEALGPPVEEPLLALVRGGDLSDDLSDALARLSSSARCRARLTEGLVVHRNVVVMAIEAPRTSHRDLERIAENENVQLVERGQGRWTAIVDADKATAVKDRLERPTSLGARIAVGTPVQVAVSAPMRGQSMANIEMHGGLDVAELRAWAQAAVHRPVVQTSWRSWAWVAFGVLLTMASIGAGYWLATQP